MLQNSCNHDDSGCLFEAWGLISKKKTSQKNVLHLTKCLSLYLKLNTTLKIGTSTIHNQASIIRLYSDSFNFVNVNRPIDYLCRSNFGHLSKQRKRLMEFLKKCTDSVTETKYQAVYDILVFKYVNIFAGQPLRFKGATCERSSKIRYCIFTRCSHPLFSTT